MSRDDLSTCSSTPNLFLVVTPAEVRLKIYKFCVPTNSTLTLQPWYVDYGKDVDHESRTRAIRSSEKTLSLARTCRQIRNEVNPIYFGSNLFAFEWGFDMYLFLVDIGEANRLAIQKLRFSWGGPAPKQQMLALGECSGLKVLQIGICKEAMAGIGRGGTIWNAWGVSTLRSIRGLPGLQLKIAQGEWWYCQNDFAAVFESRPVKARMYPQLREKFPAQQIELLESTLREELGQDREPGAVLNRRPKTITRVGITSIVGVEVKLAREGHLGLRSSAIGKRRAATEGEENRRAAEQLGKRPRKNGQMEG